MQELKVLLADGKITNEEYVESVQDLRVRET
jgi:hypothetical protein